MLAVNFFIISKQYKTTVVDSGMKEESPLLITLKLDEGSIAFFNAMRQRYFPTAINYLAAHLTLFHHLPSNETIIDDDLKELSETTSPFQLNVTEVKSLGKGVAYKIESPLLLQLHRTMQVKWQPWLTPQDRQKLWPHITVQNKVGAAEATETLRELQHSFQPFVATGLGFQLWAYEKGPWRWLQDYPFEQINATK